MSRILDSDINEEYKPLLSNTPIATTSSVNNSDDLFPAKNSFPSALFDPRRKYYRYLGLFFICFLTFGPYFCYVTPSALESQFERDLSITTTQYTLFNSLYSWPNILLCFFGGVLIDRLFGIRFGTILFAITVTVGQVLFGYGAYVNNLWIMYLGRFIFG